MHNVNKMLQHKMMRSTRVTGSRPCWQWLLRHPTQTKPAANKRKHRNHLFMKTKTITTYISSPERQARDIAGNNCRITRHKHNWQQRGKHNRSSIACTCSPGSVKIRSLQQHAT
jgi:hypothetical protein